MKLSAWLKQKGYKQEEFLNYCHENGATFGSSALAKWASGKRIPNKDDMRFINDITGGEVSPNDFYLD